MMGVMTENNSNDNDGVTADAASSGPSASMQDLVSSMLESEAATEVVKGLAAGRFKVDEGEDSLAKLLLGPLMQKSLELEMDDHLGYKKDDRVGKADKGTSSNKRNGHYQKRLTTAYGPVELSIPRDRKAEFESFIAPKGLRRSQAFEDMIIDLYAYGMSTRDIAEHIENIFGAEVSHEMVANITDAVTAEVNAWKARDLEALYPIVYFDAIHVKVRNQAAKGVSNKAVYIAYAITLEGRREVLRIWSTDTNASEGESAKFWGQAMANLKNSGVKDILIACSDGLRGLSEAIEATWPEATVQTCVAHLIRAASRWVNYADRREVAADMKPIYTALDEAEALSKLEAFDTKWGKQYPSAVRTWENAWDKFIPFLEFGPEIRRIIYTTNAIESLNSVIRRRLKTKGSFTNETAAEKVIWLAIMKGELRRNTAGGIVTFEDQEAFGWRNALQQLDMSFPGRIPTNI